MKKIFLSFGLLMIGSTLFGTPLRTEVQFSDVIYQVSPAFIASVGEIDFGEYIVGNNSGDDFRETEVNIKGEPNISVNLSISRNITLTSGNDSLTVRVQFVNGVTDVGATLATTTLLTTVDGVASTRIRAWVNELPTNAGNYIGSSTITLTIN